VAPESTSSPNAHCPMPQAQARWHATAKADVHVATPPDVPLLDAPAPPLEAPPLDAPPLDAPLLDAPLLFEVPPLDVPPLDVPLFELPPQAVTRKVGRARRKMARVIMRRRLATHVPLRPKPSCAVSRPGRVRHSTSELPLAPCRMAHPAMTTSGSVVSWKTTRGSRTSRLDPP
jgi:hypothetical protein